MKPIRRRLCLLLAALLCGVCALPAAASELLQITAFAASPESPAIGAPATWTLTAQGGSGTKEYEFHIYWGTDIYDDSYRGSEEVLSQRYSPLNRVSLTPDREGIYFVHGIVRDSSATRTVILRHAIMPPLSVVRVEADRETALPGEPVTFSAVTAGGTGYEIRYEFILYRDGEIVDSGGVGTVPWTTRSFAWTCAPAEAGRYRAWFNANGHTALAGAYSPFVEVLAPVSVASVTPDRTRPLIGATVTWTVTAAGGSGAPEYRFELLDAEDSLVMEFPWGANNTFSTAGLGAGSYRGLGYARDESGTDMLLSEEVHVGTWMLLPIQILSVLADRETAFAGDEVTWTVVMRGGSGEREYDFTLTRDGAFEYGLYRWDANAVRCLLSRAGVYRMHALVRDGTGSAEGDSAELVVTLRPRYTLYPTFTVLTATPAPATRTPGPRVTPRPPAAATPGPTFEVTVAPPPVTDPPAAEALFVNAAASPAYASVRSPVTVTACAGGGTGVYQYHFLVYLGGAATSLSRAYSASNSFSFSPEKPGNYKVRVIVKDGESKASAFTGNIHVK